MMEYFNQTSMGAWTDKHMYDDAEARFHGAAPPCANKGNKEQSLVAQIAEIRTNIRDACDRVPSCPNKSSTVCSSEVSQSSRENIELRALVKKLEAVVIGVTARLDAVEAQLKATTLGAPAPVKEVKKEVVVEEEEDDDDDVDLFGSDDEEEDAEAARIRESRLKAYAEKKSKKVGPIAKSSILLDIKPWSDETDHKAMEEEIRKITMEGLTWAASKLVPLAYGIQKLQILCIVVDDLVMMDDLTEKIEAIEDHVQSVDIAAFNKI